MPIGNVADFAVNQEPRCPVVLLLDNSFSMSGEPIQHLNEGIAVFKQSISSATTRSEPRLLGTVTPPRDNLLMSKDVAMRIVSLNETAGIASKFSSHSLL